MKLIIINLDIKKAPGINQINNKLIKPGLIKLLHYVLTCASVLAFTLQVRKLQK